MLTQQLACKSHNHCSLKTMRGALDCPDSSPNLLWTLFLITLPTLMPCLQLSPFITHPTKLPRHMPFPAFTHTLPFSVVREAERRESLQHDGAATGLPIAKKQVAKGTTLHLGWTERVARHWMRAVSGLCGEGGQIGTDQRESTWWAAGEAECRQESQEGVWRRRRRRGWKVRGPRSQDGRRRSRPVCWTEGPNTRENLTVQEADRVTAEAESFGSERWWVQRWKERHFTRAGTSQPLASRKQSRGCSSGAAGAWGWEGEHAPSPISSVRLKEGHQVREKVKDSRGKFLKESFWKIMLYHITLRYFVSKLSQFLCCTVGPY